jgi:hypothetical protein
MIYEPIKVTTLSQVIKTQSIFVISGFRREVTENCRLLFYYAASKGNFLPTFRNNQLVPYAGVIAQKSAFVFLISTVTDYCKKVVSYCSNFHIYFPQFDITLTLQHLRFPILIQSVNLDYSGRVYYYKVLGHKPSLLTRDVKISYTEYGSKP